MSVFSRAGFLCGVAALTLVVSGCAAPDIDPAEAEDSAPAFPPSVVVEEVVDDLLAAEGVPAGVVLVTSSDGDEMLVEFGERSTDEPPLDESIFAYRSITKSFVG